MLTIADSNQQPDLSDLLTAQGWTKNMAIALDILDVELIRGCGIKVTFSDGTVASYPPEELAELRPHRDPLTKHDSRPQISH
jgi:hypothetical protein